MSRHHEEVNNLKCYSFVLLNIQNYLWKCINPSIERRDLLQIFEFFPENYFILDRSFEITYSTNEDDSRQMNEPIKDWK